METKGYLASIQTVIRCAKIMHGGVQIWKFERAHKVSAPVFALVSVMDVLFISLLTVMTHSL